MEVLGINFSFRNYLRIVLTMGIRKVHNLRNMPTKPMLFSDDTLKLCGLFFASYISQPYTIRNISPSALPLIMLFGRYPV
jgi:hypothetical protein